MCNCDDCADGNSSQDFFYFSFLFQENKKDDISYYVHVTAGWALIIKRKRPIHSNYEIFQGKKCRKEKKGAGGRPLLQVMSHRQSSLNSPNGFFFLFFFKKVEAVLCVHWDDETCAAPLSKGDKRLYVFFFLSLSFLYESSHHLFASLLLPDRHLLLMTTHPTHTSSCFCTNHKNGRNKNRELVLFKKCSTFFVSAHKTEKCMKRHQLMVSISFDWKNKKKKERERK